RIVESPRHSRLRRRPSVKDGHPQHRPPQVMRRPLVMPSDRMARVRGRTDALGVDVLPLSIAADLPSLTGYVALETERLTMLVLTRDGDATLVVPRLEAARVQEQPDAVSIAAWEETDDPIAIVTQLVGAPALAAI